LPYPLPHSDIVDDDIEEYEVSKYSAKECNEESIENFFMFTLCLIEGTDTLTTKIPHQPECEGEYAKSSKVPFILPIKSISE
jgi:hypothetical protein